MRLIQTLVLGAGMALATGAATAGDPSCPIDEMCKYSNDNCHPAEGVVHLTLRPDGKAEVQLNDEAPLVSTVLQMSGMTILLFHDGQENHQLRIQADGKFNYLITAPDPNAPRGREVTMYRGTCIEG